MSSAEHPDPSTPPVGAALRRGAFTVGERVQLTDPKGRLHTITLEPGREFHTHRGRLAHDDLIGAPDGSVVTNTAGVEYLALRPLLSDYVMSMPRGAAVVYPKDAGQIVTMADIFPGARVVEAGVGSGALSMSLLRAVGEHGSVHSFERREDFADIARGNARAFFGVDHPAWQVTVGDLVEALPETVDEPARSTASCSTCSPPGSASTSWPTRSCPAACSSATWRRRPSSRAWPRPCATTAATPSPRRGSPWSAAGTSRAWPCGPSTACTGTPASSSRPGGSPPGSTPPLRKRRPAKGAYGDDGTSPADHEAFGQTGEWSPEDIGERTPSDKKVRRMRRSVTQTSVISE